MVWQLLNNLNAARTNGQKLPGIAKEEDLWNLWRWISQWMIHISALSGKWQKQSPCFSSFFPVCNPGCQGQGLMNWEHNYADCVMQSSMINAVHYPMGWGTCECQAWISGWCGCISCIWTSIPRKIHKEVQESWDRLEGTVIESHWVGSIFAVLTLELPSHVNADVRSPRAWD